MMNREEWLKKLEETGGHQPIHAKAPRYFDKRSPLELLYVCWNEEITDFQKIRNKMAKELRSDNWIVTSNSAVCEGHFAAIIKAERQKV